MPEMSIDRYAATYSWAFLTVGLSERSCGVAPSPSIRGGHRLIEEAAGAGPSLCEPPRDDGIRDPGSLLACVFWVRSGG